MIHIGSCMPCQVARVAWWDALYEWPVTICFGLALAAVLGPLLVLLGLKYGLVSDWTERLVKDPWVREVIPIGHDRLTPAWFEEISRDPRVGYLLPRTRTLAATMDLISKNGDENQHQVNVELIPSGIGDPVLSADLAARLEIGKVVLSNSAARRLEVKTDARITGRIRRTIDNRTEVVELNLEVLGILSPGAAPFWKYYINRRTK
ncbi:hypothetical protein CCP3SC15_3590002 [Gammaproteobacteria bacterium]